MEYINTLRLDIRHKTWQKWNNDMDDSSNDWRKDFLASKKYQTNLIYSQDRVKYKTYIVYII